jgi:hypothetical protein
VVTGHLLLLTCVNDDIITHEPMLSQVSIEEIVTSDR